MQGGDRLLGGILVGFCCCCQGGRMAGVLLKKLCVERWVGLPEVIAGIGTGGTLGEALEQVLPALLCLCSAPEFGCN